MKGTSKRVVKEGTRTETPSDFGHFSGDPVSSWHPDGRTMVLVADFIFTDANNQPWTAPSGAKVDGASIPKVFWSLIGGPYEGKYRDASVVHDTECHPPQKHRWQDVHRMFYSACRAGGVGELLAKVMFAAVYHFGPRWTLKSQTVGERTLRSSDDFLRASIVIANSPTVDISEIEGFTHGKLVEQVSDFELMSVRQAVADVDSHALRALDKQLLAGIFVPGRPRGPTIRLRGRGG